MKYDIAIVGGGPAGSMAGINLIGSGLRVIILDRARFPRIKPCGGGISHRVYQRFHSLQDVLKSVPTNLVDRIVLESPSGDRVEIDSLGPLYAMIRRIEFDNALLDHCKRGGIEVREDVTVARVEVEADGVVLTSTAGETFAADLVIGADGVNSTVAVHTGLRGSWKPSQLGMDGTEEGPQPALSVRQDTVYIYYSTGGYGYVFPKAHHVNFGLGYLLDHHKRQASEKPYDEHLHFLERLNESGVVTGSSNKENFHAYIIPLAGPLKNVSAHRVLLAGDAGGFVNGFTAEGIYYAMVSGEHAGKSALEAVRRRDFSAAFLQRHDQACEAELGQELRTSVMLQKRLLPHPKRIDGVIRLAARSKSMRKLLAGFGVGKLSYEEMKRRAVVQALPSYLWYKTTKLWHAMAGQ